MATAYGGPNTTLPTVSRSAAADITPCGLTLSTHQQPAPNNNSNNNNSSSSSASASMSNNHHQEEHMHLADDQDDGTNSPTLLQQQQQHQHHQQQLQQQQQQQTEMLNHHSQLQQQLSSGLTAADNGDGRSNGSLMLGTYGHGRTSPTASGSSGGGSRSSAHSMPSHSPALHHSLATTATGFQTQAAGPLPDGNCGNSATVVTSAAIMGRLTAGGVDSLGNGFTMSDANGSGALTLLPNHHAHHPHHHHLPHLSYSTLAATHHAHHPHHHHHHAHHHPHDATGLLDISTL